jgi:A/G-specific adenine glycosylase
MTVPPNGLKRLHAELLSWYALNARDLPWRKTSDPYAILVAEIMLQQTQVERVVPKYQQFIRAFPSIDALARATLGEVIKAWASLGYNTRAVRLHRLAQRLVQDHQEQVPTSVEGLRALPGLGPYTAAAVACFAFGVATPVLDTNIYRVLSRVAYGTIPPAKREIEGLAASWLPAQHASDWHQALMDVGATVCTVSRPRCAECPLQQHCKAASSLRDAPSRELAESSVPYSPKQSPFKGSSRYYRGRAVAALASLPSGENLSLDDLGRRLLKNYDPAAHGNWLRTMLEQLQQDGLVHLESGGAALP